MSKFKVAWTTGSLNDRQPGRKRWVFQSRQCEVAALRRDFSRSSRLCARPKAARNVGSERRPLAIMTENISHCIGVIAVPIVQCPGCLPFSAKTGDMVLTV